MAKKVILKDDNVEIMPITRGELVLDSSGQLAFHSSQFLATQSLPGLMSGEDKTKLDSLEKVTVEDKKVEQVNTTTNNSYRILFSNSADDTTKTEGTRKSAKLLFNPSTGALTATALIGKLDWSNLNGVPESFNPAQHIHNTSEITALTNYSKASSASDLVTTDTLNVALGKLEYKADIAYTWYKSITDTDTDDIINKWSEVVDFVNNLEDDVLDTFVTTNTKQTITGEKTFSGTSALLLNIDRNSTNPAWIRFLKNGTLLGYLGVSNDNKALFNNGSNTYDILHSGNSHIKDGVITINNQTITPITSHQSLANYVNLNGPQDITGEKTFKATIKAYDINPVTNNTYSLGTSSLAWKNVYATNGNFSSTVNASGFVKKDSSDDYILLGGGGHKSISSFQTTYDGRYVLKAGDTMTGPLTISTSNWGNLLVLNRVNNGENWGPSIIFKFDGTHNGALSMQSNLLYIGDNGNVRYKAWHEGNDGSGSGLDADTVDSCHKDDFLRRTATLGSINKFVLEDIPKGVTQVGSIGWTDYQNHPHAGGLWMTLRGTSSLRTALILFPSYSMSSPPILYSSIDGGAWQGGYQLAYTSQIPTTMAWGNVTGKPSTFTPSTHYHNYFPENTAVYFRDPNNASWRGGMYWGSAGNEALCFAVVNANTSFRFFTGSDLANWTSSTWQGTPAFEVNKNGAYAPHFYENSDINLKINIKTISDSDNIPILKEFDWKEDNSHSYGLIAQELEELGYLELVSVRDDGYKTVNYSAALSLIVGKLQVKIKELEKEIEILKNKN